MRILLYEFISGGGMYSLDPSQPPSGSLLCEGVAMIQALAADFAALPKTEVVTLHDQRLSGFHELDGIESILIGSAAEEIRQLAAQAHAADWTIVIAPEFDDILVTRVQQVEQAGGKLLSPNSVTVSLTHDKHETISHLARCGIATPRGETICGDIPLPQGLRYPVVIKPLCGAGSQYVQLIASQNTPITLPADKQFRVEEHCPGIPVSVSVLRGPSGFSTLAPTRQILSDDGKFLYLGGECPLAAELAERANRLAIAVTRALPPDVGYIGIDMVLGDDEESGDVVIEVNPRLTTSYVGLRQLANCSLAQAILDVAQGKTPDLSFRDTPIEFLADGTIVSK